MIPETNMDSARGSLVHQSVHAVRAYIRDNDLKVGDNLPGEGHFAQTLGVSRAVIREAFGALAALKLIDVANGRRAKVGAIDGSVIGTSLDHAVSTDQISVAEVWDVRRTVEVRIVALAAERRSQAQAERIVALAQAMADHEDDFPTMTQYDIAFHEAIAEAAANGLFNQIVRSFAPLMKIAVPEAWRTRTTPEQRGDVIARHRAIAEAIRAGDPDAAAAEMQAHFDTSIGMQLDTADVV